MALPKRPSVPCATFSSVWTSGGLLYSVASQREAGRIMEALQEKPASPRLFLSDMWTGPSAHPVVVIWLVLLRGGRPLIPAAQTEPGRLPPSHSATFSTFLNHLADPKRAAKNFLTHVAPCPSALSGSHGSFPV